jgi:hypothetical protein
MRKIADKIGCMFGQVAILLLFPVLVTAQDLNQDIMDALSAPSNSCRKPISSARMQSIRELLRKKALAITLVDLMGRQPQLGHQNGDVPLCSASINKIGILIATFQARKQGLVSIDKWDPDQQLPKITMDQLKDLMADEYLPQVEMDEMREMIVPSSNTAAANVAEIVNQSAWDRGVSGKKNQCYVNDALVDLGFSDRVSPLDPGSPGERLSESLMWTGKSYRYKCKRKGGYPLWCHCGNYQGPVLDGFQGPRNMSYGMGTQVANGLAIADFYSRLGSGTLMDERSRELMREAMHYPCPGEVHARNFNRFVGELCESNTVVKPKIFRKSGSINIPIKQKRRVCMGDSALVEYPGGLKYSLNVMCNNETPADRSGNKCPHDLMNAIINRIDCMMKEKYPDRIKGGADPGGTLKPVRARQ